MSNNRTINAGAVNALVKKYEKQIVKFCQKIIQTPSFSCDEGNLVKHVIMPEMKRCGYDKVWHDKMGNVIGQIGKGKKKIMMDAHIDTVGLGDPDEWKRVGRKPFEGTIEHGSIWGRGATDQKSAMAPMVWAGKIMKDLGLLDDVTVYMVGSVQEEDCDGLPLMHLIQKEGVKPEVVVLTEQTELNLYRGHRGRMEIRIRIKGRSCHGSMPHLGDNAVYKSGPIIKEIEQLNPRLKDDAFLGKGTVTLSKIECKTPSLCAVPGECTIYLDRRLTMGETKESAVAEVKALPSVRAAKAQVDILEYKVKSWTGLTVGQEKYFPTWVVPEAHKSVQAGVHAGVIALGRKPVIGRWTFSTNGVATMGRLGIPSIGFGPGDERYAHTVQERVPIKDLLVCAAFYAAYPHYYARQNGGRL